VGESVSVVMGGREARKDDVSQPNDRSLVVRRKRAPIGLRALTDG
jgi:hypothetical protein